MSKNVPPKCETKRETEPMALVFFVGFFIIAKVSKKGTK